MEEWEKHLEKWIVKGRTAERKGNKPCKESMIAMEGKRFVNFVWPAKEWDNFVNKICQDNEPNIVVWAIIMKEIMRQKLS